MLGNICTYCCPALISKLLEMNVAEYLIKGLPSAFFSKDITFDLLDTINIAIEGLRGIMRFAKEMSNPELLISYMNVELLTETCRNLISVRIFEAKGLLKNVLWVISRSKEANTPKKKHKSTQ